MKKIFLGITIAALAICLYSFKTSADGSSKVALIGALNIKGEFGGFMITYGDGKLEEKRFSTKIKPMDPEFWVQHQLQLTILINEMVEKGYHVKGSANIYTQPVILEKD